jgi:sortase A
MLLKRTNGFLTFVVILLGLYIIITPLLPQVEYWIRDKSPDAIAPYGGELAKLEGADTSIPPPEENRLVIPVIGINEPILEASNINVIKDGGTWRRPNTSNPLENNNTVIIGHRFYGNNVSTFYNLDKLKVGDVMAIYWEGIEFLYAVEETKVVDPSAIEIEAPTTEKQLTLYTCTPLWSAKNRLVIIAKPVDPNSEKLLKDIE